MLLSIMRMLRIPHFKVTDDLSPRFHTEAKTAREWHSWAKRGDRMDHPSLVIIAQNYTCHTSLCVIGCENNLKEQEEEL